MSVYSWMLQPPRRRRTAGISIDDILSVCALWGTQWETYSQEERRRYIEAFQNSPNYRESKQQIKYLLFEIIGEDECAVEPSTIPSAPHNEQACRDKLRAQFRRKVEVM